MAAKQRHSPPSSENGRLKQTSQSSGRHKTTRKKERENGTIERNENPSVSRPPLTYILLVVALASVCGVVHRNHIAGMFESDRHFSHLSTLERELAFRTEMGLYYSYFKTVIEAPSFVDGLSAVMYDNVTEYPLTINTLKRFNLYPEVFVGMAYRVYDQMSAAMDVKTKACWQVNRGQGLPPVQSCEGLGEPSYFYINNVFLLNGFMMAVFFLFATYLSNSIFGGILTVASYFYNHGEATRVQWTPPLRESFAYPFFVIQMLIITRILRSRKPSYRQSLFIAVAIVSFMLPWQFAQFALLTQLVAVFATYVLLYIGSHKLKVILLGHGLGFLISFIFLFGNEMLLTSFYASCLLTITGIVFLEPFIEKIKVRLGIWVVQGVLLASGTLGIKILTSRLMGMADDAHIGDIFRSKFTDFKNFHTMLYTCATEFDFLERETPWRLSSTLLLPCATLAVCFAAYKLLKQDLTSWWGSGEELEKGPKVENGAAAKSQAEDLYRKYRSKPHAEVVYHIFQLLAFTAMAILIMRLKLFWTPHLCLMTSLLASREFFGWLGDKTKQHLYLAVLLGLMTIQGWENLNKQWSIKGEFSNYPQEELVEWIKAKTPSNAVFGGPMPTMATVKLCTNRPIVNHPHYEDAGLRERTKKVYTMYSRKPEKEIWQNLRDLKVDYAILEQSWCSGRSRPGCGMAEVWDLEDDVNKDKLPVCHRLKQNAAPYFKRVFKNNVYQVLQVLAEPVLKS